MCLCKGKALSNAISRWQSVWEQLIVRCSRVEWHADTSCCWRWSCSWTAEWLWWRHVRCRWRSLRNWRRRWPLDVCLCRPPANSCLMIYSLFVLHLDLDLWLKFLRTLSLHPELGICSYSRKVTYLMYWLFILLSRIQYVFVNIC